MIIPGADLTHLREALASLEHARWARWQRHVHSTCAALPDGSLVIPASLAARWELQAATPYHGLSEPERDSDRREADQTIALLRRWGVL